MDQGGAEHYSHKTLSTSDLQSFYLFKESEKSYTIIIYMGIFFLNKFSEKPFK